ncbi:MAG TPA: hypothetical protein VNO31_01625 [Umezawaea sp.]|nr:hypothetical protein [Umezawaea sp.]
MNARQTTPKENAMHDIDRALFETEQETDLTEVDEFEFDELPDQEADDEESELANQLLDVSSEAELDQFLGKLIGRAAKGVRNFARSSAGRAVGGVLKSAARQALPHVGQFLGNAVAGGAGGAFGRRAGQWLGGRFELGVDTEGLSPEDAEYEVNKAFVRFAVDAAKRAARNTGGDPAATARAAAQAAARKHLPGLVQDGTRPQGKRQQEGRWIRKGNRIVLLDV